MFTLAMGTGLLQDFDTLEEARNFVGSIVVELKSSSLLLEGQHDTIKLHDIIRDVARSIAAKDEEYAFLSKSRSSRWPRTDDYSARKLMHLSFKSGNVDFPEDLVCPELHTLWLQCSNNSQKLPGSFFNGFTKLRLLLLTFPPPLSSLGQLANLRMLALQHCELSDISIIIVLKNLEILRFQNCRLPNLPLDLRVLKRLRMLDLTDCNGVRILQQVLSSMSNLEELYLPKGFKIWNEAANQESPISPELCKLTHLTNLQVHLEDDMSCSDENFCKNLLRFKISVGVGFVPWESCSATRSLKLINFPKYGVKTLFKNSLKGGMKTLVERGEEVTLENVSGLQTFFSSSSNGEAFTVLRMLKIEWCFDAEHLGWIPHNDIQLHPWRSFSRLSELEINNSGFKYLFCTSTARCLVQLQKLNIHNCRSMEEVIRNDNPIQEVEEIIEFHKLRDIELNGLPSLTSFCRTERNMPSTTIDNSSLFDGTVVFPALEKLNISGLENVGDIWDKQCQREDSFCKLKIFKLELCHRLKSVIPFAIIRSLHNLEELSVEGCKSVRFEVEGPIGGENTLTPLLFPRLNKLTLQELPYLKKTGLNSRDHFSPGITLYPNLTTLIIFGCNSFKNVFLPSVARDLVQLEQLHISNCNIMEEIIAADGKDGEEEINEDILFPMLKYLQLMGLEKLKSFWGYGSVEPPNIDKPQSYLGPKLHYTTTLIP